MRSAARSRSGLPTWKLAMSAPFRQRRRRRHPSSHMRADRHRAAVLGAGGWGTALAVHLGRAGHSVTLWGRDPVLMEEIAVRRANPTYLPDVSLPSAVVPTATLADAL